MNRLAVLVGAVLLWCSSAVQAQNLVQNPGFESGATAWTSNSWIFGEGQAGFARSGTRFAFTGCVGSACITTQPSPRGAWLYQDIPTVPGTTYSISFWYRGSFPNDNPVELQVFFGTVPDSSNNPGTCTGSCIFDTQAATNVWVQVTRQVVATSNTTRLQFLGRNDPATLYLDDVSVTAVAAPSAVPTLSEWGMLTLGLLLALSTAWALRRRPR